MERPNLQGAARLVINRGSSLKEICTDRPVSGSNLDPVYKNSPRSQSLELLKIAGDELTQADFS